MTRDDYLARQERRTRRAIQDATRRLGREVAVVVDLPELIRRRPILVLGAAMLGGFALGHAGWTGARRLARGGWQNLRRLGSPTIHALGVALAGALVGSPTSHR